MKIVFQTPNVEIINKNRDKLGNYAKMLFQEYYKFLKKDIVSSLASDKQINFDKHKGDLKNLLKMIYKRILQTNSNSLLKNYKIDAGTKAVLTIENIEEIQNQVFNVISNQIDDIANTRTDLIFSNLIEKIGYLYKSSQSKHLLNLEKLLIDLQKINIEISQYDFSLKADFVKDILNSLIEKKKTLLREIEKQNNEKKKLIMLLFLNQYDNQIVKERANSHSRNEVDDFEEYQRSEEGNIIKNNIIKVGEVSLNCIEENSYGEWVKEIFDDASRPSHIQASGQIIRKGELFKVKNTKTGLFEFTDRPRGKGLSIENSINCRCVKKQYIEFQTKNKPEF